MKNLYGINKYFLYYFIIISILAIVLTVYDKWASINNTKARIRERNLILLSMLGGSLSMYLTMVKIRHKTKHSKFMLGIPAIFVGQMIIIWKLLI